MNQEKTDEQQLNIIKRIKIIISDSTFHLTGSISHVDHLPIRLVFVALLIASTIVCFREVALTTVSYLEFKVQTSQQVYYQAPAEFPVVAWCNLNAFDQNYASDDIENILASTSSLYFNNYSNTADLEAEMNKFFRFNLIKNYLNNTNRLSVQLGFVIDQMLISCRFGDQSQSCQSSSFMNVYDYYYGSCFRFNQGKDSKMNDLKIEYSGRPGWRYGLQLELYAGSADWQEKYIPSRGFRIAVFNKSDKIQTMDEVGLNVPVGFETNVAIKRSFVNHLPAPYGQCLERDIDKVDWNKNDVLKFMYSDFVKDNYFDNGRNRWDWTVTYTRSVCLKMCYQLYLWEQCTCLDVTLPKSQSLADVYALRACANQSQLICSLRTERDFYSRSDLSGKCYEKCPIECQEIKYEYLVSSAQYPTEWYAQKLIKRTEFNQVINRHLNKSLNYSDYEKLARSVAKVNVFYDELSYTQIQDEPGMSVSVLLSSIGGSLSLFLGASLLSFCEPLELIYYGIYYLILKWKTRPRNTGAVYKEDTSTTTTTSKATKCLDNLKRLVKRDKEETFNQNTAC